MYQSSQKGMSLVEVLLALSLLGISGIAMMKLQENMNRGQVTTETKMGELEMRRVVSTTLLDKSACFQTFQGFNIGANVPAIKNATGVNVFEVNKTYENNTVKIESIKTEDKNAPNSNGSRAVDLLISLEKVKSQSYSSPKLIRVPLNVVATGPAAPIVDCFSDTDQMIDAAMEETCLSLDAVWDDTAKKCHYEKFRVYKDNGGVISENLMVTETGNVGVGITNPTVNSLPGKVLHLHHSGTDASVVHFTNNTTGSAKDDGMVIGRWYDGYNAQNLIHVYENEDFGISTNETQRLIVKANGDIGIGTSIPRAPLDINLQSGAGGNLRLGKASATEGGQITLDDGTGVGAWEIDTYGANGAESLRFFRDKGENDVMAMNIGTNGNVGISRDFPAAKLDVGGEARIASTGLVCNGSTAGAMRYLSGNMEYCNGTAWTAMGGGGFSETTVVTGPNSPCRGASIATCPTGYKVISGGFDFVSSCGCSENYRFPTESRPSGNGWRSTIECAVNRAYALCAK